MLFGKTYGASLKQLAKTQVFAKSYLLLCGLTPHCLFFNCVGWMRNQQSYSTAKVPLCPLRGGIWLYQTQCFCTKGDYEQQRNQEEEILHRTLTLHCYFTTHLHFQLMVIYQS